MIGFSGTQSVLIPFFEAAQSVLESEFGVSVDLGPIADSANDDDGPEDVTVLVGVTGALEGTAFYRCSTVCALGIVSHLMGSPVETLDDLAESGIAELGNVITGRAAVALAEQGCLCNITPPVVVVGQKIHLRAPDLAAWTTTIRTPFGLFGVRIAVRPSPDSAHASNGHRPGA